MSRPSGETRLQHDLLDQLRSKQPLLWLNPDKGAPLPAGAPATAGIADAQDRLRRCAGLLNALFPELARTKRPIESDLVAVPALQKALAGTDAEGVWLVKADHSLPVAGSIKARGGFHEVLALAEMLALKNSLLDEQDDRRKLASAEARTLFSAHTVVVGSTGNLGMSIGIMAAALGFKAVVHMSTDAKAWKKARLRDHGVTVIEHAGDYAAAVAAGRVECERDPNSYFVDDEHSLMLFLGYAAAAAPLAGQLEALGRIVDAEHPLFVYLPCGVGGAPGGITFGLKALFGEHVHCFFAEPTASPCMLVQVAGGVEAPLSIYDIGLDNRTEADGLAVGLASALVAPLMASQMSGVYTVADDELFAGLVELESREGLFVEPSAAAALYGPRWLTQSREGQAYIRCNGLDGRMSNATHVLWTTGGAQVPDDERGAFRRRGEAVLARSRDLSAERAAVLAPLDVAS
jgi:D-serine dehydratase